MIRRQANYMHPRDLEGITVNRMRAEIQADEDQLIFDSLDALGRALFCQHAHHVSYSLPLHECSEPECIVRLIHES